MRSDSEILDLVDKQDRIIGQRERSKVYEENLSNFRVVNAFIVNSNHQIWIPRRSPEKTLFPLSLDMSMGGHVESGENYEYALRRELKEELRLHLDRIPYRLLGYLNPYEYAVSAFMKVYEIRQDEAPNFNPKDFTEYYWLTPKEIRYRIENGDLAKGDLLELVKLFYL